MKKQFSKHQEVQAKSVQDENQMIELFEKGDFRQFENMEESRSETAGMVKSRNTFSFKGTPVLPKELEGKISLKKIGPETKDRNAASAYHCYYQPALDKDTVVKALSSLSNFSSNALSHSFALQTSNNKFVCAVPFTTSVYNRSLRWAAFFSVYDQLTPAYSGNLTGVSNPDMAVAFSLKNSLYPNYNDGILSFNASSNRVEGGPLSVGHVPTSNQYFDAAGILGKPSWASNSHYTSFTMMTHATQNPATNDTREFIRYGNSFGLEGTNSLVPWNAANVFKYVEVIEDICIRSVHNGSHTGAQKDNMYLYVNPNNSLSSTYVAPGTTNWPSNVFFDMYLFYGYWENRNTLSSKIVLKTKTGSTSNQGFLTVNDNHTFSVVNDQQDLRNSFLFLEQGWGSNSNKVLLRTIHGNHLKAYQSHISADWGTFSGQEQWEILLP